MVKKTDVVDERPRFNVTFLHGKEAVEQRVLPFDDAVQARRWGRKQANAKGLDVFVTVREVVPEGQEAGNGERQGEVV